MGVRLVRFRDAKGGIRWGRLEGADIQTLPGDFPTLASLLKGMTREEATRAAEGQRLPLASVELLAPATAPCQIICQGKNYLDHLLETGVKPKDKDFNLLFTKADSALAPASGTLKRPQGVRLLDYELELALVIGREIQGPVEVTDTNLHEFVAGIVMANDVSARDVQVPERQWFRGKSFRGFCPLGPFFLWMAPEDFSVLYELELELTVNGKTRQKARTAQLMHRPPETLALISRGIDLRPGDLVLTGTPGGVSMKVPPKSRWEEFLGLFKSEKEKFAIFVEEQAASGRYLGDGDKIVSTIRSADGRLDLGRQELLVRD
jgi:2,4-didehydro-3-deoxy-L-rhamnonate hydrolase